MKACRSCLVCALASPPKLQFAKPYPSTGRAYISLNLDCTQSTFSDSRHGCSKWVCENLASSQQRDAPDRYRCVETRCFFHRAWFLSGTLWCSQFIQLHNADCLKPSVSTASDSSSVPLKIAADRPQQRQKKIANNYLLHTTTWATTKTMERKRSIRTLHARSKSCCHKGSNL